MKDDNKARLASDEGVIDITANYAVPEQIPHITNPNTKNTLLKPTKDLVDDMMPQEEMTFEEGAKYQWVRSDKMGTVEEFDEIKEDKGIEWIYFKSGTRCKKELEHEYLMKLGEGFEELSIEDLERNKDNYTAIRNKPIHQSKPKVIKQKSPIKTLLEKQLDKSKKKLKVSVSINIPQKKIYDLLKESFNKEELDKEILSLAVESIGKNVIKDQIKLAINKFYGNVNIINEYTTNTSVSTRGVLIKDKIKEDKNKDKN